MDIRSSSVEDVSRGLHVDPSIADYDFGDPLAVQNAGNFLAIHAGAREAWTMASARKRWVYVWLVGIPLCAVASFIASVTVMARATPSGPGQSGGAAAVLAFNILIALFALSLGYCGLWREWIIVP